jgi:membrane protease YdiL (CAAX protease family)
MPGTSETRGERSRRLHPFLRLLIFTLSLVIAAGLLTALWIGLGLPPQLHRGVIQPWPQFLTGILAFSMALGISLVMLRKLEHRGLETIGLAFSRQHSGGFVVGLGFGALTPALVMGLLTLNGVASVTTPSMSFGSLLGATLPIVLAVLLLSSWEEIAMRGYPMQLVAEMGGPTTGAVVSGLVFGLLHAGNPGANPLGLGITALNGALLAALVIRTGSLWLACGYHTGWNLMAAVVLGLRDSGVLHPGSLLRTELQGPVWLSGGSYGFEASVLTGITELIVLGFMLVQAQRLPGEPAAREWFSARPVGSG